MALAAVLYIQPYAPIAKPTEADVVTGPAYDIHEDITEIKNGLDSSQLAAINGFESQLSDEAEDVNMVALQNLIATYDELRRPTASAFYSEVSAEHSNTVTAWTEAGERFLLNARYMGDQLRKEDWFGRSRSCFEKAVELAPDDLDIQVDLAVCLIEGASFLGIAPMEGIGMLKNVEQRDPENIKALVNLGYFSLRSGQFDRAEERFDRVLEIDPGYGEAYLYLSDLHEKQGEYGLAVSALEKYLAIADDPERKEEVAEYMEELRKNI